MDKLKSKKLDNGKSWNCFMLIMFTFVTLAFDLTFSFFFNFILPSLKFYNAALCIQGKKKILQPHALLVQIWKMYIDCTMCGNVIWTVNQNFVKMSFIIKQAQMCAEGCEVVYFSKFFLLLIKVLTKSVFGDIIRPIFNHTPDSFNPETWLKICWNIYSSTYS